MHVVEVWPYFPPLRISGKSGGDTRRDLDFVIAIENRK
jgi:hypothetical protein